MENARLKELRNMLGLSQKEFAEKIGLRQGSLSDVERGRIGISNVVMALICKTFSVNEDWLRTGNGEPFKNQYEYRNDLSDLEKEILIKFNMLEKADQKALTTIIDSLYKKGLSK